MTSMVVTRDVTYRGDSGYNTGAALDGVTLAGFLDRIVRVVAGAGVVLLDRWAAGRLHLPVGSLPAGGEGKRHPAAVEAREAGWEVPEIHRWTMFRRGGHEIHIGLLDFIDPAYCPLIGYSPLNTAGGLDAWQTLSGMPYWGDPGDAVNALLMQTARPTLNRRPYVPTWRPRPIPAVEGHYARTFSRAGFDRTDQCEGRYLVGYDATRAYLSALTTVEVAGLPLKATGRRQFDRSQAGWWLVHLEPWTDDRLPAPWGYYPGGEDVTSLVWLTTPDLDLLSKLHAARRYGGYTIVDSYTAAADRYVMRPLGDRLREMWDGAGQLHVLNDRAAIRDTIKAGYQAVHSKWRTLKGNGDVRRPDWAAALVATARTNLWRRIDKGWAPAYVDGIDTVYYATDHPDQLPRGIVTERYPLNTGTPDTDKLGTFRAKYLTDREAPQ